MKKTFKKLFLSLISLIIFLLLLSISINYFFSKNIDGFVLDAINENINTECSINNIRLNIIKSFPHISIELQQLKLNEASGFDNDTLLYAKKVLIEFNFLQILKNNFNIKRIIIQNGKLNLKYFNNSGNYNILKTSEKKIVNLEDIKLYNSLIQYSDSSTNIISNTDQLEINLVHSGENKILSAKGYLMMDSLNIMRKNYIDRKKMNVHISLVFKKNKIEINPSKIEIEGLHKNIQGEIRDKNNLSLIIKGEKQKITSVIYCTPKHLKHIYNSLDLDGLITYVAKVEGVVDKNNHPSFNMSFEIEDGLFNTKNNFKLNTEILKGSINNGDKCNLSSTEINVSEFNAITQSSTLSGSFSIYNLNTPLLETSSFISKWDLKELNNYFTKSPFKNLSGTLLMKTDYYGKIAFNQNFKNYFQTASYKSDIELSNVKFLYGSSDLSFLINHGKTVTTNNLINIDLLEFTIGDSDFSFKGEIKDLPKFISNQETPIEITGDLTSVYIKFDELLKIQNEEQNTLSTTTFPKWCKFNLSLNIDNLTNKQIIFNDLNGRIKYSDLFLSFESIQSNVLNGKLKFNGKLYEYNKNHISLLSKIQLENINIRNLFSAFNNFKQSFIQDKHLKGLASGEINLHSNWDPNFKFNTDNLKVTAEYIIEKGELIDFSPLKKLSSYVNVEDLKNVKFSKLENSLEIKNNLITIPKMDIKSSVLTVSLSGTHDFNNEIDYSIQLLLSEILSNEFRRKNTNLNQVYEKVEINNENFSKIYLKMTGNTSDPKIYFDKIYAKKKLEKKLNEEKETVKTIIREDILNDIPKSKTPIQDEDLIIEWEDEI